MFVAIRRVVDEGSKTFRWWTKYKHQAGTWPWSSIIIHSVNWVVILFGGGFLIWWSVERDLSRWQFLGIFLLLAVPYGILENWAKRSVKLKLLRQARLLAKLRGKRQTISTH
jgi:hypothetical protein